MAVRDQVWNGTGGHQHDNCHGTRCPAAWQRQGRVHLHCNRGVTRKTPAYVRGRFVLGFRSITKRRLERLTWKTRQRAMGLPCGYTAESPGEVSKNHECSDPAHLLHLNSAGLRWGLSIYRLRVFPGRS